jgi:hypothetical protein
MRFISLASVSLVVVVAPGAAGRRGGQRGGGVFHPDVTGAPFCSRSVSARGAAGRPVADGQRLAGRVEIDGSRY